MSDSEKEVIVPEKKGRGRPAAEKSDDKVKRDCTFTEKNRISICSLSLIHSETQAWASW